jgi:hypothetical protein
MEAHDLDRHHPAVVILCEKYLQEDTDAMMLLNKILNLVADFALIDELSADNDEFDYAEEMQELIWATKSLNSDLERDDLLRLGNYATQLVTIQFEEKNND